MIYKKLFDIQKKCISVKKDWKNPFTKSGYITLDNIVDTLTPVWNELELLVYHRTEDGLMITSVKDTTDDSFVESKFRLIESNDPQKLWSCITYAKRYNLGQIFNIITDRDDDWESAKPITVSVEFINSCTTVEQLNRVWIEIRKQKTSGILAGEEAALITKAYNEKSGTLK